MHNRDFFWKPFASERVNESQKLLKSAEKYFHPLFSTFWAILSFKKLFLIRSDILGLVVNTLFANYVSFRSNRGNVPFQIQIKLSKNAQHFLRYLYLIFGNCIKLPMFRKKNERHRWILYGVIHSERCAYLSA